MKITGFIFVDEQSGADPEMTPIKIGMGARFASVLYSNNGPPESPYKITNVIVLTKITEKGKIGYLIG